MQAEVGQDLVLHAHEEAVLVDAARTCAGQATALVDRDELHVGRDFHGGRPDLVEGRALELAADDVLGRVQGGGVEVVRRVVLHLQPVAVLEVAVGHELIGVRHREVAFPLGEGRLLVGGAHVGEDQAVALDGLVGTLADGAGVLLGFLLLTLWEGHVQAGAVHVEHHAVIAAADAVLHDRAVLERGAAMHAVRMKDAHTAAAVAEGDQLFAQDLQEARGVGQFHRHAHGVPEGPHVFAHRRARADLGQLGIMVGHLVDVVAAVGNELLR